MILSQAIIEVLFFLIQGEIQNTKAIEVLY